MALIECTECGKQISDQAATCPGCGAPVRSLANEQRAHEAQLIEQTGKEFKALQLIGFCVLVLGLLVMMSGNVGGGMALGGVGLVLAIGAKVGAWWHHG